MWSWQGSNLRPSRCKRDALPTELQPRKKTKFCSFNLKWVWVDSNYRPPPYQSGALTNWATNPKNIRELCENKNQYKVRPSSLTSKWMLLRKEVIQPHLPVRLPCYDFAPVTNFTLDSSPLKGWDTGVGCDRLPWRDGRCVQDPGTYSPLHADERLLAIPTSCSRVADYNPNLG